MTGVARGIKKFNFIENSNFVRNYLNFEEKK